MRERETMWVGRTLGLAFAAASLVGGACSNGTDGFSTEEWARVKMIQPLSVAMPPNLADDRADDDTLAKFGQKLFYDRAVAEGITATGPSGNMGEVGKVGCVTCHDSKYFADSRPYPQSHGRSWLSHNTPAMVNLGWFKWTLWTGTFDSLAQHGASAWGASATPLAQAHYLYKNYRDEYNALFPDGMLDPALDPMAPDAARFPATGGAKANAAAADGPFEKMAKADQWKIHQLRANLAKVFDAYPRKLVTPHSAFEQYISGENRSEESFSARAKNGLKLFIGKASCIDCHNGPLLSDNQFHNVGVPGLAIFPPGSTTVPAPDRGRAGALTGLLNNALATLRTNAMLTRMDPVMDELAVFSGAGQFSANPEAGMKRLVDLDAELCMPGGRTAETVAATCALLFKAPRDANPTKVPPDLGDPGDARYPLCVEANSSIGLCAHLNGVDDKGVPVIVSNFDPSLEGAFRTPQLLNIAETGPYFHTGEVKTLREVVAHYNKGGGTPGSFAGTKSPRMRPLLLSDAEVDDLVEFLKTLTGDAPAREWTCNPLLGPPAGCGPEGAGATGGAGGASAGGGGRGGATGAGGGNGGNGGRGGGSSMGGGSAGGMTGSAGATAAGGSLGAGGLLGGGGRTGGAPGGGGGISGLGGDSAGGEGGS